MATASEVVILFALLCKRHLFRCCMLHVWLLSLKVWGKAPWPEAQGCFRQLLLFLVQLILSVVPENNVFRDYTTLYCFRCWIC
jgi:hypothetical protein